MAAPPSQRFTNTESTRSIGTQTSSRLTRSPQRRNKRRRELERFALLNRRPSSPEPDFDDQTAVDLIMALMKDPTKPKDVAPDVRLAITASNYVRGRLIETNSNIAAISTSFNGDGEAPTKLQLVVQYRGDDVPEIPEQFSRLHIICEVYNEGVPE